MLPELIDNKNKILKEDLLSEIKSGSKLSIAAACFSIYAFQELKEVLSEIDELRFIFTSPTFTTEKSKKEQQSRIKNKAEVFTPSWICNKQNNLVDNAWFGRENVFNKEIEQTWETNFDKIVFEDVQGKTWQDYVRENRLEISCGEAPYLVSRYDTVTGEQIKIKNRIGLLDRKFRVISENVDSEPDWYEWAQVAIKSIFGFDWQGDNVLLARENVLFSFIDYYFSGKEENV